MDNFFDFLPSPERARLLDERMRSHLIESLDYLAQCVIAVDSYYGNMLASVAQKARLGSQLSPAGFGLYYDIVSALIQEELELAIPLIKELSEEIEQPAKEFEVLTLDELMPKSRKRYQRLMDMDPNTPFSILSPLVESAGDHKRRLKFALERLKLLLPELAGEVEALVRQVILVIGDSSLGYDFAGGSCYMLWGALFINADSHPDELLMMEAIAHESAHSLLFGFTIDEPLVLNDADERFTSPLRDDPRPMDGIYHATFVCARMYWAMRQLSSCFVSDGALAAKALARADLHARSFHSGMTLIREHGLLSSTGRSLIDSAEIYMTRFSK